MYGKVFDSIYTGTLYGHWEAIVTFQQMIVLCDADGIVDMTPQGICGRTSIPLEIILKGLEVLADADPYTRTPGSEGRRIELIDSHRPWGWRIINHSKYKKLQDADMVRAQTAERVRKHRELKRPVTDGNGQKRHTDTDTDTDTDTKNKRGRFTPPSVDEVKTYCQERKNSVNPQSFHDFYSSKNWMVGKNKMIDWQASVRTWEGRETNKPKPKDRYERA